MFDTVRYRNRTDLRLTLDEAPDYELLNTVYEGVQFDDVLPSSDAIDYIDKRGIGDMNANVEQITLNDITEH